MCDGPLAIPNGSNHDTMAYCFLGVFLKQGRPILFLLGRWMSFAFMQCVVMAIALWFSTYCRNPLITIISPFVIYYFLAFFIWMFRAPAYLLPARQIKGDMTGNDVLDLSIYMSEVCAIVGLFSYIYMRRIKELIPNA